MADRCFWIETILFNIVIFLYLASMVGYLCYLALKKEIAAGIATVVTCMGFVLHTAALVVRGIGAGRLPLTNQYEFATSFSWGVCLCFLIFLWKFRFKALGAFVTPVIFLLIGYAAMQSREVRELMPALRSNWLAIHVMTAIIAYGSFGVAAAVSMMYLLREKMQDNSFWKQNVPEGKKLDMISYRAVCLGFFFLSLVLITGAIWAEAAWGSYWSWDPKETWALITWIIYAIYLHLRLNRGWKNRKTAMFAVIGFVCVIFTYIGVNTFLPGIHSYAGILSVQSVV